MKINPQSFFNFCAQHATLLRALAERGGEFSEADALRLIRANPGAGEELPETAWRRLRELQILVPTEPGGELYFLADPVARLLTYLYNEANPATPEMIRGYVLSLETTGKRLARALDDEDISAVKRAFDEITQSLQRIHADLDETHRAILGEVARYKTERSRVSVREKFRRIVHWMYHADAASFAQNHIDSRPQTRKLGPSEQPTIGPLHAVEHDHAPRSCRAARAA